MSTNISDEYDHETDHLLNLGKESDFGDVEYKYQLTNFTDQDIKRKAAQLKYRLNSSTNYGQAIYVIGVVDDGFALGLNESDLRESLDTLQKITEEADAKICGIQTRTITHYASSEESLLNKYLRNHMYTGKDHTIEAHSKDIADAKRAESNKNRRGIKFIRNIAEVIIRKNIGDNYIEIRCGVAGHVDCGKSTLLGVLTRGKLDNSKGSARSSIVSHKHELDTGRTSSIGQHIIGFNGKGEMINDLIAGKHHQTLDGRKLDWPEIVTQSSKIITFFDLAGHEKYLRTTLSGISSNHLDYALIMVGANLGEVICAEGSRGMTVEHLSICITYKILPIIVITKIDMAPPQVLKDTLTQIKKLLKRRFAVYTIDNDDQVLTCARLLNDSFSVVPVLQVSNVSGEGLDRLKYFLNLLPSRHNFQNYDGDGVRFQVQEIFQVKGIGNTIVGGILTHGTVRVKDILYLGPNNVGEFVEVKVRSIECKRVPVNSVTCGKYICLDLQKVNRKAIKRNMFLIDSKSGVHASWEFLANIRVGKTKSGSISVGYQPYCHIGHIKQACKILEITNDKGENVEIIGAGDEANVRVRFCFHPEIFFDDDKTNRFIFREGNTRGCGVILSTTSASYEPIDNKDVTKYYKLSREEKNLRREMRHLQPYVS